MAFDPPFLGILPCATRSLLGHDDVTAATISERFGLVLGLKASTNTCKSPPSSLSSQGRAALEAALIFNICVMGCLSRGMLTCQMSCATKRSTVSVSEPFPCKLQLQQIYSLYMYISTHIPSFLAIVWRSSAMGSGWSFRIGRPESSRFCVYLLTGS